MAITASDKLPRKPQVIGHMPKRTFVLVFIVAVLLNYPWELAQAPLYVGMADYNAGSWLLANNNRWNFPSSARGMGGSPYPESMAIYREHAEVAGA
jgi:hypothetical protein